MDFKRTCAVVPAAMVALSGCQKATCNSECGVEYQGLTLRVCDVECDDGFAVIHYRLGYSRVPNDWVLGHVTQAYIQYLDASKEPVGLPARVAVSLPAEFVLGNACEFEGKAELSLPSAAKYLTIAILRDELRTPPVRIR